MRPIPILLALVVVLGFVSEAGADDYIVTVGDQDFGIYDSPCGNVVAIGPWQMGVPFTATQGLIGFCAIAVGLVALVTLLTFRWKRRAANLG